MHKILHKFTKTFKNQFNNSYIASRMSYIDVEILVHLKKQSQCRPAAGNPKF